MSTTSFGSSVLQTAATPQSPLGALRETADHSEQWVYCLNNSGGALAASVLVKQVLGSARGTAVVAGAGTLKSVALGVTTMAVPQDHYFWARRRGAATLDLDGAASAGDALKCAASGEATPLTPGAITAADIAEVIGHVEVAVGGAGTTTCWLDL